jgi:uncharacterized protein (TIGR00299 family) protein
MIAYFDCFSGISGDMTLAAFIDLGVPVKWLNEHLARIPLSGFELQVSPISRSGIQAQKVNIAVTGEQGARNYTDIQTLIEASPLADAVKARSLLIFDKIAEAEAIIHNCPKDHVHFHEVGGVDAIVDIVGASLCIDYLGLDQIFASRIPLGTGFVTCQHGTLPIPAPATLAILKDIPVYGTGLAHELVTPTGAAIITTISDGFVDIPAMQIDKVGYGAGHTEIPERPNLLRIFLGAALAPAGYPTTERIRVIETNIDDMNPELFGHLMDRLKDDGALDVLLIPVYMKKNRPGTLVQVLCPSQAEHAVIHRLLSETTSLGVRISDAERQVLMREAAEIETDYGRVTVKRVRNLDGSTRLVPEYEVCRKIAQERNLPLRSVYETILKAT